MQDLFSLKKERTYSLKYCFFYSFFFSFKEALNISLLKSHAMRGQGHQMPHLLEG